jgi:hypothetical protein
MLTHRYTDLLPPAFCCCPAQISCGHSMTAIDCSGIFEEFSDGKYKGNGYCTNTDKEGHKLISRWSASSDTGTRYEVAAGTGKFELTQVT